MKVRLGDLLPGWPFTTRLTGRMGTVLRERHRTEQGVVKVALESPDEEKTLHEDVIVEA